MNSLPLRCMAPAKINLGLFVGPRRDDDGRHELVSVMQSISLADELTLDELPLGAVQGEDGQDRVVCPDVPELEHDNLALDALAVFRRATRWDPGGLTLHLVKRVPVAAGMGGGSGDAAAVLRLAARASGIADHEYLHVLAQELGADVPAQVAPGRWLALGAGERLTELPAPREPFGVLVLPCAASLSTAAVYGEVDRLDRHRTPAELERYAERLLEGLAEGQQLPHEELLANDLQAAALSLCPEIGLALEQALAADADVAMVSGSGPTVIGLFAGARGPERAREAAAALGARRSGALAAVPVGVDFARPRPVRNNDGSPGQV